MFIGYIQNNKDKTICKEHRNNLLSFTREREFDFDCVYSDSFADIRESIAPGYEGIIVYNIGSLGSSLKDIEESLHFCWQNGLEVFSIAENYQFNRQNLTDDFFKGIDFAIEVRSRLLSQNTKKVLRQKKNEGMKLGRPFGAIIKKKLEGKEEEIRQLLLQKVTKVEIARRFGVSRITVFNFIKRNGLASKESYVA